MATEITNWMLDLDKLDAASACALTWRRAGWRWAEYRSRTGQGDPTLRQAPAAGVQQRAFDAGQADFAAGRSRFEVDQAAAPDAVWSVQDDNADAYGGATDWSHWR